MPALRSRWMLDGFWLIKKRRHTEPKSAVLIFVSWKISRKTTWIAIIRLLKQLPRFILRDPKIQVTQLLFFISAISICRFVWPRFNPLSSGKNYMSTILTTARHLQSLAVSTFNADYQCRLSISFRETKSLCLWDRRNPLKVLTV